MTGKRRNADPVLDVQAEDEGPSPQASPDPPSSPGLPVAAIAGPANSSPLSPVPTVTPYAGCGVLIPALPA
jgi:hypothetical protein